MDVLAHNRIAWDAQVERRNRWTVPVSAEKIDAARQVFCYRTGDANTSARLAEGFISEQRVDAEDALGGFGSAIDAGAGGARAVGKG